MNGSQFLSYGVLELVNVPHAQYIADEVLKDDCYDLKRIPHGATVIDLGAFYGEFALYCAKVKKCHVIAVEASRENFKILSLNLIHNKADDVNSVHAAISNRCGDVVEFSYNPNHPAGSKIGVSQLSEPVDTTTLNRIISTIHSTEYPVVVKMDIEGAEKEVFESIGEWSSVVSLVLMEWHNQGGEFYRDALIKHGFDVSLEAGGVRPRTPWNKSQQMGFIYATKKQ